MKNLSILPFILFFCTLGFVSSSYFFEEINSNLHAGETFVGKIELDLKNDLILDDLKIFEGRREIFLDKGVFRRNNVTFFYIIFPKQGDFRIETGDLLYSSNGSLRSERIFHNISIGNASSKVLTLKPGILFGTNLSIFLVNSGSEDIEVSLQGNTTILTPNVSKNFEVLGINEFFYLDIQSYRSFKVPVFPMVFHETNLSNNTEINISNNYSSNTSDHLVYFLVASSNIEKNLVKNKNFKFNITLENYLNESLELGVLSNFSKIDFSENFTLEPFSENLFYFDFFSEETGVYSDKIVFISNESNQTFYFTFYVFEEDYDVNESYPDSPNITCEDLGGELCLINQECIGGIGRPIGGYCCVGGVCKDYSEIYAPAKKNYLGGFFAVAIVGGIGYLIFKKFKAVKSVSKI